MTVILTILTVEPLSIMLKLSGWGLCLVLETSCGACVYRYGVIAILTFILSLNLMMEISCGACVYRYGAKAILTSILKGGACVWCRCYQDGAFVW